MAKEEREGLRKRGRKAARLLEDLSGFGPNQLASDMDSFLSDGSVFAKAKSSKFFDAVWQVRSRRCHVWFRSAMCHSEPQGVAAHACEPLGSREHGCLSCCLLLCSLRV
jgi:hypothetical protein